MSTRSKQFSANDTFNNAVTPSPQPLPKVKKGRKRTVPISVRVTQDEKEQLQYLAGNMAIGAYIRQRIFGEAVAERSKRYIRKQREPSVDTVELARLPGMFGQSELATSMLALSLAAAQGNLNVTDEVQEKIECACADIDTIKLALIMAIGVKPQEFG